LSFKCRHCHEYGHFQRNCPKIQDLEAEKTPEEGWQQSKKSKANPKRRGPKGNNQAPVTKEPPSTAPETSKEQDSSSKSRSGNSFAVLEEQGSKGKQIEEGEISPDAPSSPPRRSEDNLPENPILETEEVFPSKEDGMQEATQEEGTEEEGTDEEDIDPSRTAKKERRGRKPEKERREVATYKDKAAGTQPTLDKHLMIRNTRQHGAASKGAALFPKGK